MAEQASGLADDRSWRGRVTRCGFPVAVQYRGALVLAAALLLVFLIGLSRLYLGVHYPSDVLAGYAAAFVWVVAVAAADRLMQSRSRETT